MYLSQFTILSARARAPSSTYDTYPFLFLLPLSRPFATPSSNCPVLAVRVTLPCFLRNYSLELECQSVNGKPSNLQLATARFSNNFLFFHRIVIAYITTKEKQTNSGQERLTHRITDVTLPSSAIRFRIEIPQYFYNLPIEFRNISSESNIKRSSFTFLLNITQIVSTKILWCLVVKSKDTN